MSEKDRRVDRCVELDGEPLVVFHVIGTAVALKRDDGSVKLASRDRVDRALEARIWERGREP